MLVSELERTALEAQLQGPGLVIRTGPFVNRLRSSIPLVADGVSLLYADFPIASDDEFVEYTVNVNRVRGPKGWVIGEAYTLTRGDTHPPFYPFSPRLGLSYLEWGLNFAVYRGNGPYLVLHAAVLERAGRALIILGDSGDGKSTLCSGLALSGWRLLSDELGLVSLSDGLISPLARPISLKNESIGVIQAFAPHAVISSPQWTKRKGLMAQLKPPTESVRRMDELAEPAWLVQVKHVAGAPLAVQEVPRSQAFAKLLLSGFNYGDLGEVGFRLACQLIDRCTCRSVQYSQLKEALDHFDSPPYRAAD